jgi:ATP-dependent DNA helicase RecQ
MRTSPPTDDPRVLASLREVFGFASFRPNQREIVEAILAGRDAFVVMPTGGGKSLCYQLPARLLDGTCLVVSPLISLMKDQVDAAVANGLRAAFLNSSQEAAARREVTRSLRAGELDLLYVSPERFAMEGFTELLKACRLSFVAIDEAHCISSGATISARTT